MSIVVKIMTLIASMAVLTCSFAGKTYASPPSLIFPLDCSPGNDCWIESYVDVDSREEFQKDYTCGQRAADGSNGIRITFPSLESKLNVRAAASGKVMLAIDNYTGKASQNPCGNGI